MQYKTALTHKGKGFDPFIHEVAEHMLEVTEYFFVIPARAPFTKDHLLIVPKRKVILLNELLKKELNEAMLLISKRDKILHKHHTDVTLILKDGKLGGKSEKSINHLHFHLVPDCAFVAKIHSDLTRKFYEENEFTQLVTTLKKTYNLKSSK